MSDSDTSVASAKRRLKPREWHIEVCKTCSRIATWPFCDHRPEYPFDINTPRWTEIVVVRQVGRAY